METIIELIGFTLLWAATDVGRKKESRIRFISWKCLLIGVLLLIGITLIEYAEKIT